MKLTVLTEAVGVKDLLTAVNTERLNGGLAALQVDPQLNKAAQLHADAMAAASRMAHDLPGSKHPHLKDRVSASGYKYKEIGENLAAGFADANKLVSAWMGSTNHKRNVLHPGFTQTGIGIAADKNGRSYFCQVYGAPTGSKTPSKPSGSTKKRRGSKKGIINNVVAAALTPLDILQSRGYSGVTSAG